MPNLASTSPVLFRAPLVLSALIAASQTAVTTDTPTVVGCGGLPLYARQAAIGTEKIQSPDRTKSVLVRSLENAKEELCASITLHDGKSTYATQLLGWNTEVLWSPDSSRFAVNQTTGGGGFGQKAYVFSLRAGRLRRIEVSRPVEKAFGSPVKCEIPVRPNTAIIKWLEAGKVLVVAEVVPVSVCKCSGSFRSYEVSLADLSVNYSYSQTETKGLFVDSLGCELQHPQTACAIGERKQASAMQ